MALEFEALQKNRTWRLVDRLPGAHIVTGKWVFKHKLNPDSTLERYKARWVVRGFTQRAGVDFDETFTPVVKPATIRTVLTIAASQNWATKQLDVSNAFLHGHLKEHVLCPQPTGFVDVERPDVVCLLDKSLYGLRQAPRAWFEQFAAFVIKLGFTATRSDWSLFMLWRGRNRLPPAVRGRHHPDRLVSSPAPTRRRPAACRIHHERHGRAPILPWH
jgi:hypothetical protein